MGALTRPLPPVRSPSASAFPGREPRAWNLQEGWPLGKPSPQEPRWPRGPNAGVAGGSGPWPTLWSFSARDLQIQSHSKGQGRSWQVRNKCWRGAPPQVGMGPAGGQRTEGPGRRGWSAAGPSPDGAGASFTSDHVAGEGPGWRPRPSQAVGGHLPSAPLLSRSFWLLFIRRRPSR